MNKKEKMLGSVNYVHPIKWSYPMAAVLEEGCHRQHIYRGERRLKIYEI
jgi:hypothetical protein